MAPAAEPLAGNPSAIAVEYQRSTEERHGTRR
jgi:hypothetical protein